MKVLHVITGLAAGGAETQLELLLQHTCHASEVVALYNVGSVGKRIVSRGAKVHDLDMRSNRQALRVLRLARLMRQGSYDVVHVHLYRACIYGRLAARLAKVPVCITTEHSIGENYIEGRKKSPYVRGLYMATDLFSDATVAVSPVVRERLIEWGVPRAKIRVIPNGIDSERFTFDPTARADLRRELGIPSNDFVVGCVGRLNFLKGCDRLLDAMVPLLESDGWLLLVGEGPEKPRLQRLARKLNVDHRVVFTGERPDIPRLLSTMDVFASASAKGAETYGLAPVEAAAAGLRVVATDCPALEDIGSVAFRRVPGEDIPELRRALLAEQSLARCSGPLPKKFLLPGSYDIREVTARLDSLYESLVGACREVRSRHSG